MTENNTQHAPVRAAAPTTLTAEEIKAQLTESGIPEHLHPYFPRGLGELIPAMGIKFQELTAERTVATMPVAGNTQPIGLLHGGANVVLAETLGSLSAGVHGGENLVAVGVDINATHVRPAVSGVVTATCTAVKLGRTLCIHSIDIVDERYFKRYPKIVRAKRIVLPIAIGVMLVCLVTAINNPGSFWWLGVMLGTGGMLWAGSPTDRPISGPNNDEDDFNRYMR